MSKLHTALGFESIEQRLVLAASAWGASLLPYIEQDNLYQNDDSELSQKVQKVHGDDLTQKVQKVDEAEQKVNEYLQKVQKVNEGTTSHIKDGMSNTMMVGEIHPRVG